MTSKTDGWIIWVNQQEQLCIEGAAWAAHTLNNDEPTEYGFGDTAMEAVGELIGILTRDGSCTIREIHTRDEDNKVLYPNKVDEHKKRML